MTKQQVAEWLLSQYLVDTESTRRLVACITSQDLSWLGVRAEQHRSARWGEDEELLADDFGVDASAAFALTALVECHEGPHTADCPDR